MSPTMQDSKFEVIMSSESDLEEGEIPEFNHSTSKTHYEDGEILDEGHEPKYLKYSVTKFKMKHRQDHLNNHFTRHGRLTKDEKKFKAFKANYSAAYRSSSSDGEFISEPKKNIKIIAKHSSLTSQDNVEKKMTRKHNSKGSYGTVEDIMSQIDQTLCRKSRDYDRRKLRDKYSSARNYKGRSPVKESKLRCKHHKIKRSSSSDSDSENVCSKSKTLSKSGSLVCKRKREKESRKSKDVIYLYSDNSISDTEDNKTSRKRTRTEREKRDFDEYRKQLLEKLSKEKSESTLKCKNIPLPDDERFSNSSDIQEIEMTDDTNTFIDDQAVRENCEISEVTNNCLEAPGKHFMDTYYITRDVSQSASQPDESETEDDDTELIKLRLLALTSNRRKKEENQILDDASSHSLEFEQSNNVDAKSEEHSSDAKDENDSDLDRNEFFLRAEALKTAVLKKHQKRLKKTTTDNKNDSFDGKDSDKTDLLNSEVNNFSFLKVENEKLNMGEELSLTIKTDVQENSVHLSKSKMDDKMENITQFTTDSLEKMSTNCNLAINSKGENDLPLDKPNELTSLEIARRKLPLNSQKNQEVSNLEIARSKLPKSIEKQDENLSLEIARQKLLKVRNALNQKNLSNTTLTKEKDAPKDSLQARLLALANESSLPKPLLSDNQVIYQFKSDAPQNMNLPIQPPNMLDNPTERMKNEDVLKIVVGKRGKPNRRLKRLRRKQRKIIQRKEAFLNKVNTSNENSTNSSKLIEDDEKLRIQLLNDLDRRKVFNENNKDVGLVNKQMLPNQRPNEVLYKPPLQKHTVEIKKNHNIDSNSVNINKTAVLPIVPKTESERIIIHLGPDSSDDDFEPEDKSRNLANAQRQNEAKEWVPDNTDETIPNISLPIDVEKSVELLLQRARLKAEAKQRQNQKAATATPEAVYKHLPPSQRLEYIRLKQKIAEKENLKKKNNASDNFANQSKIVPSNNSGSSNLSGIGRIVGASIRAIKNNNQTSETLSNEESSAFNGNENSLDSVSNEKNVISESSKNFTSSENCDKSALEVKKDKGKLSIPPTAVSTNKLTSNLVTRSPVKAIPAQKIRSPNIGLKKATTASSNGKKLAVSEEQKKVIAQNQASMARLKLLLKNIKVEKTMEERYEKEIQRLKTQLNLLELKRKQQRLKIEKLAKESKMIYARFQSNREEKKNIIAAQQERTNENKKADNNDTLPENSDANVKKDATAETKDVSTEFCERIPTDRETNGGTTLEEQNANEPEVEVKSTEKIDSLTDCTSISSYPSVKLKGSDPPDLKEYSSPLQAFTARTEDNDGKRIDPNTIMCQYDLLGKCNDEECAFQHYRTS